MADLKQRVESLRSTCNELQLQATMSDIEVNAPPLKKKKGNEGTQDEKLLAELARLEGFKKMLQEALDGTHTIFSQMPAREVSPSPSCSPSIEEAFRRGSPEGTQVPCNSVRARSDSPLVGSGSDADLSLEQPVESTLESVRARLASIKKKEDLREGTERGTDLIDDLSQESDQMPPSQWDHSAAQEVDLQDVVLEKNAEIEELTEELKSTKATLQTLHSKDRDNDRLIRDKNEQLAAASKRFEDQQRKWKQDAATVKQLQARVDSFEDDKVLAIKQAKEETLAETEKRSDTFLDEIERLKEAGAERERVILDRNAKVEALDISLAECRLALEGRAREVYERDELIRVIDGKLAAQRKTDEDAVKNQASSEDASGMEQELNALKGLYAANEVRVQTLEHALKEKNKDTEQQAGALQEELEEAKKEAGVLQGELKEAKKVAGALQGELEKVKKEVGALQGELEEANKMVGFLQRKLEKAKNEAGALQGELEEAKKEAGALQEELAEAKKQRELEEVEREAGARQGELEEAKKEAGALQGELEEAKKEVGALQGELEEAKKEAGALQGELEEAKKEAGALQGELEEAKKEAGALQGELEEAKKEAGALQGELEEAKKEAGALQGELEEAKKEAGALQGELEEAKKEAGALQGELEEAKILTDELGEKGKATEQQVKTLEDALEEKTRTLLMAKSLQTKNSALEQQVQALEQQLKNATEGQDAVQTNTPRETATAQLDALPAAQVAPKTKKAPRTPSSTPSRKRRRGSESSDDGGAPDIASQPPRKQRALGRRASGGPATRTRSSRPREGSKAQADASRERSSAAPTTRRAGRKKSRESSTAASTDTEPKSSTKKDEDVADSSPARTDQSTPVKKVRRSQRRPTRPVVMLSGFKTDNELKDQLSTMLDLLNCTVRQDLDFDSRITHVVAPPGVRTMKTLAAGLTSRWMVTPQWVKDSDSAGKLLAEDSYGYKAEVSPFQGKLFFKTPLFEEELQKKKPRRVQCNNVIVVLGGGKWTPKVEKADILLIADGEAPDEWTSARPDADVLTWMATIERVPTGDRKSAVNASPYLGTKTVASGFTPTGTKTTSVSASVAPRNLGDKLSDASNETPTPRGKSARSKLKKAGKKSK